jgi:hypothetical protein
MCAYALACRYLKSINLDISNFNTSGALRWTTAQVCIHSSSHDPSSCARCSAFCVSRLRHQGPPLTPVAA